MCSYCTKAKLDQSGRRSLWAIATRMVCNKGYYFWNIVKTSIEALKLFALNVRNVYATISLPESEQEQRPDYRQRDGATSYQIPYTHSIGDQCRLSIGRN